MDEYNSGLHINAASLEELITHGLHALRETLQQDKELTIANTSIGIVGPASTHERGIPSGGPFRILEGEPVEVYLKSMVPKETPAATGAAAGTGTPAAAEPAQPATAGDDDVQMEG